MLGGTPPRPRIVSLHRQHDQKMGPSVLLTRPQPTFALVIRAWLMPCMADAMILRGCIFAPSAGRGGRGKHASCSSATAQSSFAAWFAATFQGAKLLGKNSSIKLCSLYTSAPTSSDSNLAAETAPSAHASMLMHTASGDHCGSCMG